MQKGQNFNHPKHGRTIKVEPIKDLRDIKTIKTLLADKPRDLALFTSGDQHKSQGLGSAADHSRNGPE